MENPRESNQGDRPGSVEARYLAFLETITTLRPSLHRYCSRMTGSVLDGEDIVQEALLQAYRKLEDFEQGRPVAPWLFRIAHNCCIDFLNRRKVREHAEAQAAKPDRVLPTEPPGHALSRAVEYLVLRLPPKERACILLKDVFEYSLAEIADLVGSTVGGVKAALKRGRSKLAELPKHGPLSRKRDEAVMRILRLYVERFNRRDWDSVRELISADARLQVADRFYGSLIESSYFANYERWTVLWRMELGEVDGEPVIIRLQQEEGAWLPRSVVRLDIKDRNIVGIRDYGHCPWVLPAAQSLTVARSPLS